MKFASSLQKRWLISTLFPCFLLLFLPSLLQSCLSAQISRCVAVHHRSYRPSFFNNRSYGAVPKHCSLYLTKGGFVSHWIATNWVRTELTQLLSYQEWLGQCRRATAQQEGVNQRLAQGLQDTKEEGLEDGGISGSWCSYCFDPACVHR